MIKKEDRKFKRIKRHLRIRKKVFGTSERPRLSVFRSEKHIYAQIIDDTKGHTLVSASTLDPDLRARIAKTYNKEAAKEVGKLVAQKALSKGISQVVFDRGGFKFHGRIRELADAAREAGLKF
ncbi:MULTISPECIES: 50S ribosomal protein L18 [Pseudothermotoga]|uniref:Large ribosomal subunit protein uL18 n=1 Tax=Pseudothermotoga lettingae (strain ATCC BAA-301 / DSM 14385 / NBRC 107922 / TMO) TaxID=416591 RepID=RL18_PSELT|nr:MULTISPECIES: 50S ribosomal protein L18 [Pseudothermotoga]A8F4S7.1 RecName: Full=Large ribosomal subunit protein uL18; AltName: Full=50S ribosomal protein L18 [Pseudothermotoga lettingae TMO]ABV33161.1 ribosomal protein L18 [Pseudothermotoga lettingae TMO]KUK21652.1 MAG: 50S ribosomal protein L18 [Pseudothermotoga lettingae]MDI3494428.1 large subunit ribosomal protein [Pseudothermotoga sp.]MDK2884167.1 large subunit ribosomal protein [Pseudothermotoga sp.]GLI47837.1 50S ribosomal protein L